MYILQEKVSNDTWLDKTKHSDYAYMIEMYNILSEKNPDIIYRVIEVFIYVWIMWAIFSTRDTMFTCSFWCVFSFLFSKRFVI